MTADQRKRARKARRPLGTWAALGALGALAVVIALMIALQPMPGGGGSTARPGGPAPDFTVVDIDGREFTLSDHRGQVVLLDFMGVNCAPCRQEMPHLVAVHGGLAPRGLVMISIDVGMRGLSAHDPEDARSFMGAFKAEWQIALEGGARAGALYGVTTLPTIVVVDDQGVIRWDSRGEGFPIREERLVEVISPLLAG